MKSVTIADVRDFWENHPLGADEIDAEPGSPEYFAEFDRLREAIEPPWFQRIVYAFTLYREHQVLDVGCGNGWALSQYVRHGAHGVGIDLAKRAVEISRQRFALLNLPGEFAQANAEALPFPDNSFDLVVSFGVLHHTPDTESALREIYRVVKPGGHIRLMLYHKNSLYYRLTLPLRRRFSARFRGMSQQELVNRVDGEENPLGKTFSKSEVRRLLNMYRHIRFFVWGLSADHLPCPDWWSHWPRQVMDFMALQLGWFLYVQARK